MSDNTRHMNDTTMPPPPPSSSKQPRQPGTAATSPTKAPPPARQKTALRRGFGLSDWYKLLHVSNDLAQLHGASPRRRIPWNEIKQHREPHDGWVVLRGRVYNLSPYLPYHPGGERILRNVLGKDITALYDKYHTWVNQESYVNLSL